MNTANTTICISSFFKLNIDNHKKKEFRCLVCQFEYNNDLGFPQTKISMRDFAPMRCFWEQNKLAHDLWYWQLSTAVHPLGDLIVVEI